MKRKGYRKNLLAWMMALMLVLGCSGYANGQSHWGFIQNQKPAPANNDLLKSLELALAELESLRKVKSLQVEQIDALQGKVRALEELVEVHKQIAAEWKKAASERATANALDAKQIALFEETVRDAKAEITRIRGERDSARRGQKVWGAVGLLFGIALGVYAAK